jgi:hypothetical protein
MKHEKEGSMKWRLVGSIALLVCVFLIHYLQANQSTRLQQQRIYKFQFNRILRVMDLNGNRKIARTEWRGKETAFNMLDSDKDGYITEYEFCNREQLEILPVIDPVSEEQETIVIQAGLLIMTGMRLGPNVTIQSERLVMTGKRGEVPGQIQGDPLIMTGMRLGPNITLQSERLVMTGNRGDIPGQIQSDPLIMTGMRLGPNVTIRSELLIMTGKRE